MINLIAASNWLDCISKSCISTLIHFRWLSIAGHAEVTKCAFAVHAIRDLTLSFMPICKLCQLADKPSESQRTWKKGAFHLVSHFNSAYNPRGERTLLAHRQLSSANREGLFFDKVQTTRERAYWFFCDMHENLSRMGTNTCVCTRVAFLSTPNKRAAENCYLPF